MESPMKTSEQPPPTTPESAARAKCDDQVIVCANSNMLCLSFECFVLLTKKSIKLATDNPPPLPVTLPPLKEKHFAMQAKPPATAHAINSNNSYNHAMMSPPSAYHHHLSQQQQTPQQSPKNENFYNVHLHQQQGMLPSAATGGVIPHPHFRHPAELSYSTAEMRQS